MILSRSAEPSPSSLMLSNNRFSCRAGSTAGALGDCIAFLRNDRNTAPAVCGLDRTYQHPLHLDECAEHVAWIASLIETCKLNDVEPQAYFADVLAKPVNLWPASRIDELMPWAWAAARRSTDRLAA